MCITQCTDIQKAMAFALILLGKISERRPRTGPAPIANENTNLQKYSVNGLYNKMELLSKILTHLYD